MKEKYIINGKVTYPQGGEAVTTFTFLNQLNGDMFTMQTLDKNNVNMFNYGDDVEVSVTKIVKEVEPKEDED